MKLWLKSIYEANNLNMTMYDLLNKFLTTSKKLDVSTVSDNRDIST